MGMTFEQDTSAQEHYEIELETVEKSQRKLHKLGDNWTGLVRQVGAF